MTTITSREGEVRCLRCGRPIKGRRWMRTRRGYLHLTPCALEVAREVRERRRGLVQACGGLQVPAGGGRAGS